VAHHPSIPAVLGKITLEIDIGELLTVVVADDKTGVQFPRSTRAANQGIGNRTGVQSPESRTSQKFAENCKWRIVAVNLFRE
jgi:hypothetical protein